MQGHPCRKCNSSGRDPRDPAYSCDDCTKPGDYDDYCDQEHDRRRDDKMTEEEDDAEQDTVSV